ncbi:MAG: hypothetical protein ACTSSJ_01730 [Candidatus Odinarchaeia archaeon]
MDLEMLRKIIKSENEHSEKDLVLIKEDKLENTKCGVCNEELSINIYVLHGKIIRKIYCKHCGAEVWK